MLTFRQPCVNIIALAIAWPTKLPCVCVLRVNLRLRVRLLVVAVVTAAYFQCFDSQFAFFDCLLD